MYCPTCAPDAVRAVDRMQGLEYYARAKEIVNPKRNEKRREISASEPAMIACGICGKVVKKRANMKYCSEECKREALRRYWRERSRAKRAKCAR